MCSTCVIFDIYLASMNPLALLSLTVAILFIIRSAYKTKHRLPPGPPGLPFIGSLLQLLGVELRCLTLKSWSQKYGSYDGIHHTTVTGQSCSHPLGPLFYLNLGGKPAVVIGSHEVAEDLLEIRGNIYSDQPANIVVAQIMTRGLIYAFVSPHGSSWRRMRKASHE